MSTETNKTVLKRFFEELFNRGDLSVADEIVGANYVNHNAVPGETPGREGLKAFVTYLRTAFPDVHFTVEDQIAEGDKVVTRWSVTGTQQGEFAGIPATGKPINVTAINIHRVSNDQIQEAWLNWDTLGMMQQLGVIPAPSEVRV
ncbi:MAG: ester cyclase [Anaerolineales bacterium]|nr:ester cyclase [Anaerolineales bacterium]